DFALAGAELRALRPELPARRHDVTAARGAHGARIARPVHDLRETLDLLPIRALVFRAGPGIERDQVDLGRDAGEQLHQRLGVGERIVDTLEHDVLEGDAPRIGQARVVAARIEQLRYRIFAVERHELVAE